MEIMKITAKNLETKALLLKNSVIRRNNTYVLSVQCEDSAFCFPIFQHISCNEVTSEDFWDQKVKKRVLMVNPGNLL